MPRRGIDISIVILCALCLGALGGFGGAYYFVQRAERAQLISEAAREREAAARVPFVTAVAQPKKAAAITASSTEPLVQKALPSTGAFNLDIAFFPQAPKKNWDVYHEDYCEEAAVLGVHAFLKEKKYSTDQMEVELEKMRDWEINTFGYFESTSIEQTARIAREYLGYKKVRVIERPTIAMIRAEVAAGHPVIVPANGKQLKNPHFKNGGPEYHMYVIRGFTERGDVITNDPGTQFGENYVYKVSVVMSSMADWNNGEDHDALPTGTPAVLVIE
ncbi:MAG: hypothetical protein A2848_02225 [Candidatus Magasanikbacteria bacterium RIFCSPHIGHO2_01_FULL_50_8]|uniref:Peptidase C39-like domain-containing protein n=1 Tax=Candidatus Magasanikbacteria bacterium RIFCSPHIGHO2_01_FULL_50_8 TaxID=1798674 RepID=A0A1F6LPB1_9BACT|nr:MAG: hypothetical protein A2848_02225 [Candidatus Magasanikbacteria bacterium RIFCSPHIGHO2_01_FULL_50_8]